MSSLDFFHCSSSLFGLYILDELLFLAGLIYWGEINTTFLTASFACFYLLFHLRLVKNYLTSLIVGLFLIDFGRSIRI